MVLAFVQAEWSSPRFGPLYEHHLRRLGLGDVSHGALSDFLFRPDQHTVRAWLLGQCRGFGLNRLLFRGFPSDVSWMRWTCPASWFAVQRYARFNSWLQLTRGSLLVRDGADRLAAGVAPDVADHVSGVVGRFATDWQPQPVVVLMDVSSDVGGQGVLIEGHTRATAYALHGGQRLYPVLLGRTSQLSKWAHF